MGTEPRTLRPPACSIVPWLSVRDGAVAVAFYKPALGAEEVFHLEDKAGSVVSRLSVDGAGFWVSDEAPEHANFSPESLNGSTARMIITVAEPDTLFARANRAGAREIHPVHEELGWRVAQVVDPFGHHGEICRPLADEPG